MTKSSVHSGIKNTANTDINLGIQCAFINESNNCGTPTKAPYPPVSSRRRLLGISNLIVNHIAGQNGIRIHKLSIKHESTFNIGGVLRIANDAMPFASTNPSIVLITEADCVSVKLIKRKLPKGFPVNAASRARIV